MLLFDISAVALSTLVFTGRRTLIAYVVGAARPFPISPGGSNRKGVAAILYYIVLYSIVLSFLAGGWGWR